MKFIERVKESFLSHIASFFAVAITTLLIWTGQQLTPIILPAIEANISKAFLFSLFLSSLVLNLIFVVSIWIINNKNSNNLKLKYGILWDKDKNPYCPSCKKPGIAYGTYGYSGDGYYCQPCNKVFLLKDALGNEMKPTQALSELK
jgi:hypothetical protein